MIEVIPHGVPDLPFVDSACGKEKLGLEGKTVILTFGLLSPSKGIETMIDAMPRIVGACPNAVYIVLGATHPNLLHDQGETYRDKLTARVRELGLEDHVLFFNRFVRLNDLLDFIAMSDVYVSPYLDEAQITSGALAYSFGLGKAVVSTPYWHAQELLHGGRGVLVPFRDPEAMSREIIALLTDEARRNSMRQRAYVASRSMTWAQTAKRYVATFDEARDAASLGEISHRHTVQAAA
jgi:glycosyltransferase involved in cell wall biosynthesis